MSGGASLGSVQVGMLQALDAAGVRPDFVVGTSVGALNGSILAAHPDDGVARLDEVWRELQRRDVFPGNLLSSVWRLGRTRTHAIGTEGLERIAARALDAHVFEDLELPLGVVALDLTVGESRVLTSGELVPALLASAAIPGVFPPVEVGGHVLVDGSMLSDVAVPQALAFHLTGSLVLLDCLVPVPANGLGSVADVLAQTSRLQFRERLRAGLGCGAAGLVPIVSMPPPGARRVSPFDFSHTTELIDEAREAGSAFLESLVVSGPGIHGDPFGRYAARRVPAEDDDRPDTVAAARAAW